MSAESKESQPSIDYILSSIREIIADDSAEKSAPESAPARNPDTANGHHENGAQGQPDILSVLRGGQAQEPLPEAKAEHADEQGEEVLDLSEDFIVTDAAAALRREQERLSEAQAEAQVETATEQAQPEDAPTEEPAEADPAIAQANVWAEDFQMPVGDEGPTSPFTATQTHPESAWPSNDPFDVTESYKLARSQQSGVRFARTEAEDGQAEVSQPPQEETAQAAEHGEEGEQEFEQADEPGIELTSLSEGEAAGSGPAQEESEPADEPEAAAEQPAEAQTLRAFPAADELEAVFGMPPRAWAGAAQPQAPALADEPAGDSAQEGIAWGEAEAAEDASEHAAVEEAMTGPEAQPIEETWETDAPAHQEATEHSPAPQEPDASEPAQLAAPPASVSGKTLEDSVKELLRPMLQEWLDNNMPRLVEAAMREQVAASQEPTGDDNTSTPDHRQDEER